MRSDRVLRRSTPPHTPHTVGRPRRHGSQFAFGDPATWGHPDIAIDADTRLYGPATVRAWNRLHPPLTHRTARTTHVGHLPILDGTVVRLQVDRLPSAAIPKPVWLWHSRVDPDIRMVDLLWQAFLRRFDIEHTFRLFKQTLGWTRPKLRTPEQADRWGWLILAAYTQLRLARRLTADLRRPWETRTTRPAHPSPGTPRISAPTRTSRLSHERTKTNTTRTRTPNRPPQPPASHPPRRAYRHLGNAQKEQAKHAPTTPNRLKLKLERVSIGGVAIY